jgi:hypothetical protein
LFPLLGRFKHFCYKHLCISFDAIISFSLLLGMCLRVEYRYSILPFQVTARLFSQSAIHHCALPLAMYNCSYFPAVLFDSSYFTGFEVICHCELDINSFMISDAECLHILSGYMFCFFCPFLIGLSFYD